MGADDPNDFLSGVSKPRYYSLLNLMLEVLQRHGRYDWILRETVCEKLVELLARSFQWDISGVFNEMIDKKVLSLMVEAAQGLPDTDDPYLFEDTNFNSFPATVKVF